MQLVCNPAVNANHHRSCLAAFDVFALQLAPCMCHLLVDAQGTTQQCQLWPLPATLLEWLLLQVDMLYGRKIQAVPEQVRWIQSFTVSCRAHIPSRQSAAAADHIAQQLLRQKLGKGLGYQASPGWLMRHHDRSGVARSRPVSELLQAQAQPPSFCICLRPGVQMPGQFVGVRPPSKGNGLGDNQKLYSIACSPYESRRDSAYIGGSIIEVRHPQLSVLSALHSTAMHVHQLKAVLPASWQRLGKADSLRCYATEADVDAASVLLNAVAHGTVQWRACVQDSWVRLADLRPSTPWDPTFFLPQWHSVFPAAPDAAWCHTMSAGGR